MGRVGLSSTMASLVVCASLGVAPSTLLAQEATEADAVAEVTADAAPAAPPTASSPAELDDVIVAPPAAPAHEPAPPVPEEEFEQVEPLLGGVPSLELVLDDERGEDLPWDDYDPYTEHGPKGLMHFGAQLRGSALFTSDERRVPFGPSFELAAFVDFRFSRRSPWHIRIGVGLSWQTHVEDFLGAGRWVTSSPGALRLRVQPFALDLGRYLALRLGPSIGVQLVPRANEEGFAVEAFGGGTAELALRLLDGLLEIGVHGGAQLTGVGDAQRPNEWTPAWRTGVLGQPVLGASVAGVLP